MDGFVTLLRKSIHTCIKTQKFLVDRLHSCTSLTWSFHTISIVNILCSITHIANCCHTVGVIFTKYELTSTTVVTNKVCFVHACILLWMLPLLCTNIVKTYWKRFHRWSLKNHHFLVFPFYMQQNQIHKQSWSHEKR